MPLLLALLALLATVLPAAAESLVTALSSDRVSITSNFTGSQVVVFGTIERDAQTISRSSGYQIVVTLTGPPRSIVARRKERFGGIWLNRESEVLNGVPSFLAIAASEPLAGIAGPQIRAKQGLGFDMLPINALADSIPPIRTDFDAAYVRLMQQHGLFNLDEDAVEFLSAQLFRAPIDLPANVPVGWYRATVYLFNGGVMISKTTQDFNIRKSGFEQFVTDAAHRRPALFGLATVLIALFTGWLAGVVFRKD